MSKTTLTAERVRSRLNYDAATGVFTWKVKPSQNVTIGAVAGNLQPNGRVYISIDGRSYLAHRLAWLYVTGKWPDGEIDHRDTCPTHNWFSNLRDVTRVINMQNKPRAQSNSKLGVRGVYERGGRFIAGIRTGGKRLDLGAHDTLEEARGAYLEAKRQLHPGFISTGEL